MPDPKYETVGYAFDSRGLVARFAPDRLPEGTWANLENIEARIEAALSSRYGRIPITVDPVAKVNVPLPAGIHTLARLKSLNNVEGAPVSYRYAGAGDKFYRRAGDGPGSYVQILDNISGVRLSTITYCPTFSSFPYLYLADSKRLAKDSGAVCSLWGIHMPAAPVELALGQPRLTLAETFDDVANFTFSSLPV